MSLTRVLSFPIAALVSAALLTACGGGAGGDAKTGSSVGAQNAEIKTAILSGASGPAANVGVDGDYFLDTITGRLYGPKSAGVWPSASLLLVGPAGPVGVAGTPGSVLHSGNGVPAPSLGNEGDFFIDRGAGVIIGPKTAGVWPTSGVSIVGPSLLNGTAAPSNAFGADGDFYINTTTSTLFGPKSAGAWPAGVSLVGSTGATGNTGAAGADGNTILSGIAGPAAAMGKDGDFYLNTATSTIFGPKAGGVWPAGVSLVSSPYLTKWDYGVFKNPNFGNLYEWRMLLGGGIDPNSYGAAIVPAPCATMTVTAYIVGRPGSFDITLMRKPANELDNPLWTDTGATCTVNNVVGPMTCSASISNLYDTGDLLAIRGRGYFSFDWSPMDLLSVSAVCR